VNRSHRPQRMWQRVERTRQKERWVGTTAGLRLSFDLTPHISYVPHLSRLIIMYWPSALIFEAITKKKKGSKKYTIYSRRKALKIWRHVGLITVQRELSHHVVQCFLFGRPPNPNLVNQKSDLHLLQITTMVRLATRHQDGLQQCAQDTDFTSISPCGYYRPRRRYRRTPWRRSGSRSSYWVRIHISPPIFHTLIYASFPPFLPQLTSSLRLFVSQTSP